MGNSELEPRRSDTEIHDQRFVAGLLCYLIDQMPNHKLILSEDEMSKIDPDDYGITRETAHGLFGDLVVYTVMKRS